MKLETVTYQCEHCGQRFTAPALNPYLYGEFLLRSPTGALRHLDALADPTYSEVDAILSRLPSTAALPAARRADVLRPVYGEVAADSDVDGAPFGINTPPRCPNCGAHQIAWFEAPEPPHVVDIEVPPVTHRVWAALDPAQRVERVRNAATAYLAKTQATV